jgi:hypothetical protein
MAKGYVHRSPTIPTIPAPYLTLPSNRWISAGINLDALTAGTMVTLSWTSPQKRQIQTVKTAKGRLCSQSQRWPLCSICSVNVPPQQVSQILRPPRILWTHLVYGIWPCQKAEERFHEPVGTGPANRAGARTGCCEGNAKTTLSITTRGCLLLYSSRWDAKNSTPLLLLENSFICRQPMSGI